MFRNASLIEASPMGAGLVPASPAAPSPEVLRELHGILAGMAGMFSLVAAAGGLLLAWV